MPPPTNVLLLIGADTALVDESSYARTLTAGGNAARTTSVSKFGGGSITFDGTGDRIQVPDSPDLTLTADFTVEGWFRFLSKTDNQALMGQWDNGGLPANCSWFLFIVGGKLTFRVSNTATTVDPVAPNFVPTLGQWYHIAVDRKVNTVRAYVDGVVLATGGFAGPLVDSTGALTLGTIGTSNPFPSFDYNGQMDEIRITNGLAQYNGAFTPPTGPFPRTSPPIPKERTTLSVG